MIGWLLNYAAVIPEERPKLIFFISLTKPGKVYFSLKNIAFSFVTRLRTEIMEMSAMTKNKRKRMLRANEIFVVRMD